MEFWDIMFVLLVLIALVCASYCYYEMKVGVATFPTMPTARKKMIEAIQEDFAAKKSQLPPGHTYTIIDMGSGSGQLTWRIARAMPEAKVVGIELSIIPWLRSVVHQKLFGPANLSYARVNFWPYDVSKADVVITYLFGPVMEKMSTKLRQEMKSGSLVLSNKFRFVNWDDVETTVVKVPFTQNLYVYRLT